jgi:hypothetical protein
VLGLLLVTAMMSTATSADGYKLVWTDEFIRDGKPDQNYWTYEHGYRIPTINSRVIIGKKTPHLLNTHLYLSQPGVSIVGNTVFLK